MTVCDDWRQVRGVLNTILCDWFCDDWRQVRGVLNITLCDRVCADWRQVRGVLNTTLCDRVCDDWGRSGLCSIQPYVMQFVITGGRSEVYSI